MKDADDIIIDGDIVNGTFSSRAPKIKLNAVRFIFRDPTVHLIVNIFLFIAIAGVLVFALWSKILGTILLALSLLIVATIWRYISLRKIEFKNAVLCPGLVVALNPPSILILSSMGCGGSTDPVWAVAMGSCRSLKPFPETIGTRIPCVTAFQGDGLGGSWDKMVATPLISGIGNKKKLNEALARLDDEEEWRILEDALLQKRFPKPGETLRL